MEISKNINSKVNLNNLYSPKEIEDIKKIIPKLNILINSNINKNNRNPINSYFAKNKTERKISRPNYIDRNEFIELILEKAKLQFKQENNIVLSKSISFIIEEMQKNSNEPKKLRKNKFSKLTNNSNTMNYNYNKKLIERNILTQKNSPSKNPFFENINTSSKRDYSSRSHSKKFSNDYFPYSKKKLKYNKYRIMNNTVNNSINKKFLDIGIDNYRIKSLKGSSIINNFITFSNTTQTISTTSNSNLKLNKDNILDDLSISNNIIYNTSRISKLNSLNRICRKNKSLLSNKIQIHISNIKRTKTKISHYKNTSKYSNNEKSFNHVKNNLTEFEFQNNYNTNTNFLCNRIKKIERIKTDNILDNKSKNYNKKSIKKQKIFIKNTKKDISHIFNKELLQLNIKNNSIIESKDFDVFEFDNRVGKENTLLLIGNYIFVKYSFSTIINEDKFNNWCRKIAIGYTRRNPYHSDLHAADVAQTCFIYMQYGQVNDIVKFNKVSFCSLFLSCICHDYKHPGVNNDFLKETKNELAIRYNDLSILENMHISETFKLINQNNDCNIFSGVDSNTYKEIRQKMIACVLSTDMTDHSNHITFMKNIIERKKNKKIINNDNQKYMDLIIHAADISNPTKPYHIYFKWAKLVLEEFFEQGDREKTLGIPCSNDRKKVKLNLSQMSFIDYVVGPFISLYVKIFPKLKFLQDNIIINKEKFANYCEDEKSSKKKLKTNNKIKKINLKDSKIKEENK